MGSRVLLAGSPDQSGGGTQEKSPHVPGMCSASGGIWELTRRHWKAHLGLESAAACQGCQGGWRLGQSEDLSDPGDECMNRGHTWHGSSYVPAATLHRCPGNPHLQGAACPVLMQSWRAQKPGDAEALLGNTADAETSRRAGGWGWGNGSFSRHGDGRGTTASVRGKARGPWS